MQKSKKSLKRLDKHQTDCNGLSNRINKMIKIIKEIRPNSKDIINIAETYRNKILEIDRELSNKSIDFWDGNFELRKAIDFDLKEKLGIGISNILNIATQVISIEETENITKSCKNRRCRYITKAIFNLNEANSHISNYNIEDNINKSLLTYFINVEYKNNFFQIYKKMRDNLECLDIDYTFIEPEIFKIIEYREKNKNNYNKENLLKDLYPELKQDQEIVKIRTL